TARSSIQGSPTITAGKRMAAPSPVSGSKRRRRPIGFRRARSGEGSPEERRAAVPPRASVGYADARHFAAVGGPAVRRSRAGAVVVIAPVVGAVLGLAQLGIIAIGIGDCRSRAADLPRSA